MPAEGNIKHLQVITFFFVIWWGIRPPPILRFVPNHVTDHTQDRCASFQLQMIKFFRNIRQNLLSEGRTGKYFKYAIGEIILVVVGILIALQINNWNEQHKLRKLEVSYYKNLKIDLVKDSLEYEWKILNAQQNMTKLTNILNFIESGYDISKTEISDVYWDQVKFQDTAALWLSISQSGFVQFPHIFQNTITDLRATGNIKLLTNNELKNQLANYYNFQKVYDEWNQSYLPNRTQIDVVVNHILPFKS